MITSKLNLFSSAIFVLASMSEAGAAQPGSMTAGAYWPVEGVLNPAIYVLPPYSCTANYYVAPNGSDTNAGTSTAPWQTISHAIAALSNGSPHGGVCVNAAPGTYTESLYLYNLNGSADTATGYLVFRSSTPHGATLQEPYANIATYKSNVLIQNSHFVIFDGFNVVGYPNVPLAGADGFFAMNTHHIKFLNNIVHDVGGAGIGVVYSDYVSTQGNVVYDTACCNTSGASAVAYWEPIASDTNPGFHNVISRNIVFNNSEGADGRSPHTEGHGIVLDSFRLGPSGNYTPQTLIENNLVYGNGGIGINIYYSNNITVRNNTVFNNLRDPLLGYASGDIAAVNSSHITGVNNIAVTNITTNSKLLSIWDQTWDHTNIGNVWAYNLTFNGNTGQPSVTQPYPGYGTPITAANGNILGADPLLVNPSMAEFMLYAKSPAIGHGTTAYGVPALDLPGNTRTSPADIGAFAYNMVAPM